MIYWVLVVIVVVIGILIAMSVRRNRAAPPPAVQTHKTCSYCNEEIAVDAEICKYCRGVVVN